MTICSNCGGVWDEVRRDHCPGCGTDKDLAWRTLIWAASIVWAGIIIGIAVFGA